MYRTRIMREFICFYFLSMYSILVKFIYNIQNSRPRHSTIHTIFWHGIRAWLLIFLPSNSFLSSWFRRCLSYLLIKSVLIRAAPNQNRFFRYFCGCRGSVFFWNFFLVHHFVLGSIYFLWIPHLCVLSLQAQIILPGHIHGTNVEKPSTFDKSQDVGSLLHGLCLMHASCLGFLVQWSLILSPTCGPIAPLNLCGLTWRKFIIRIMILVAFS